MQDLRLLGQQTRLLVEHSLENSTQYRLIITLPFFSPRPTVKNTLWIRGLDLVEDLGWLTCAVPRKTNTYTIGRRKERANQQGAISLSNSIELHEPNYQNLHPQESNPPPHLLHVNKNLLGQLALYSRLYEESRRSPTKPNVNLVLQVGYGG